MTSHKPKTLQLIIVAAILVSIGLILVPVIGSCPVKHMGILSDIKKYEETLDAEFCESIVYRIDAFNEECEPEIEIIDCG